MVQRHPVKPPQRGHRRSRHRTGQNACKMQIAPTSLGPEQVRGTWDGPRGAAGVVGRVGVGWAEGLGISGAWPAAVSLRQVTCVILGQALWRVRAKWGLSVSLLGISAEKETAERALLFQVSPTSPLFGRVVSHTLFTLQAVESPAGKSLKSPRQ